MPGSTRAHQREGLPGLTSFFIFSILLLAVQATFSQPNFLAAERKMTKHGCPSGYYQQIKSKGSLKHSDRCFKCPLGCKNCSSSTSCQFCSRGFALNSHTNTCTKCHKDCSTCNPANPDLCLSCKILGTFNQASGKCTYFRRNLFISGLCVVSVILMGLLLPYLLSSSKAMSSHPPHLKAKEVELKDSPHTIFKERGPLAFGKVEEAPLTKEEQLQSSRRKAVEAFDKILDSDDLETVDSSFIKHDRAGHRPDIENMFDGSPAHRGEISIAGFWKSNIV